MQTRITSNHWIAIERFSERFCDVKILKKKSTTIQNKYWFSEWSMELWSRLLNFIFPVMGVPEEKMLQKISGKLNWSELLKRTTILKYVLENRSTKIKYHLVQDSWISDGWMLKNVENTKIPVSPELMQITWIELNPRQIRFEYSKWKRFKNRIIESFS